MRFGTRISLVGLAVIFTIALAIGASMTGCVTTASCLCPTDCDAQEKGGSELWAENCTRCHNLRPPDTLSDAEWETAMMHMRVRANLTGEESRKIVEFLKSAN